MASTTCTRKAKTRYCVYDIWTKTGRTDANVADSAPSAGPRSVIPAGRVYLKAGFGTLSEIGGNGTIRDCASSKTGKITDEDAVNKTVSHAEEGPPEARGESA